MKRTAITLSAVVLIVLVAAALFLYLLFAYPAGTDASSLVWQVAIPHFATGLSAGDGKVFVDNDYADVECFNGVDGANLWNTSLSYANYGGGPQVKFYDGKIYSSQEEGKVYRLNIETGAKEIMYQAPAADINNYKRTASFFVADGKLFATNAGTAVFDADSGVQLWKQAAYSFNISETAKTLPSSSYVYMVGGERVNPNTGEVMWFIPFATDFNPIVYEGNVIFWNYASNYSYPQNEHAIICLNAQNGKQIWRADFDDAVFKPVASDGLLLFCAYDGYFYALNIKDGSVEWKTYVDTTGVIVKERDYLQNEGLPLSFGQFSVDPLVDVASQKVYCALWSSTKDDRNLTNQAEVFCLNSKTGNNQWNTKLGNSTISRINGSALALLNSKLFVCGYKAVYCLSADSGDTLWHRDFEHYVGNPVVADGKVYITADLYVLAYK